MIVWKNDLLRPWWCRKLKLHMKIALVRDDLLGSPQQCRLCGQLGDRWA